MKVIALHQTTEEAEDTFRSRVEAVAHLYKAVSLTVFRDSWQGLLKCWLLTNQGE